MTEKIIKDLILQAPAGQEIFDQGMSIIIMLLEKNISYGNSALSPLSIFSNNNAGEQLDVRIDDKLNRIKNAQGFAGDNDIDDLIGYLVLLWIQIRCALYVFPSGSKKKRTTWIKIRK